MTSVVACIPTIGMSPLLLGLVQSLFAEGVAVRLMVNSDQMPDEVQRVQASAGWGAIDHRPGHTIYQEMNEAAQWACDLDAYLLVLNDDIEIAPSFALALRAALDEFSDYGLISSDPSVPHPITMVGATVVPASFELSNRAAFANWAFIARPAAWQMIGDYEIWYGDDDLIRKVNAAGWKTGFHQGTGVRHETSTTFRRLPWVNEAVARDHARWTKSAHG